MAELPGDQIEAGVVAMRPWANFLKWAWTPLYAKIWWGLAGAYWVLVIICCYLTALIWLRDWLLPSVLMLAFHPFFMLTIMGFGTLERWWYGQDRGDQHSSESERLRRQDLGPSGLHWEIDPLDPRSAAYWSRRNKFH